MEPLLHQVLPLMHTSSPGWWGILLTVVLVGWPGGDGLAAGDTGKNNPGGGGEPHVLSELPRPVVWGGVRYSWTITARVMLPFEPLLGPHPPRSPHILSGSVPLPMSSGRTLDINLIVWSWYLPWQPSPMGWKVYPPPYLRNVQRILSDNLIKTLFLFTMALF